MISKPALNGKSQIFHKSKRARPSGRAHIIYEKIFSSYALVHVMYKRAGNIVDISGAEKEHGVAAAHR